MSEHKTEGATMSKQTINRLKYRALRRDEQHAFNLRVLSILEATCGAFGKPYFEFKDAAERFAAILHDRGFVVSLSVDAYDRRADEAWRGLDLQIEASLRHPDETVRLAAQNVKNVFSKTENPTKLNYDQEYGALAILLSQLKAIDRTTLELAHVDVYIDYLDQCVRDFNEAYQNATDTKSKQDIGAVKSGSNNCYQAWQNMAKYLEAMVLADALPGAADAIEQINIMNTAIKRRLALRKVTKINAADDDTNIIDDLDKEIDNGANV